MWFTNWTCLSEEFYPPLAISDDKTRQSSYTIQKMTIWEECCWIKKTDEKMLLTSVVLVIFHQIAVHRIRFELSNSPAARNSIHLELDLWYNVLNSSELKMSCIICSFVSTYHNMWRICEHKTEHKQHRMRRCQNMQSFCHLCQFIFSSYSSFFWSEQNQTRLKEDDFPPGFFKFKLQVEIVATSPLYCTICELNSLKNSI